MSSASDSTSAAAMIRALFVGPVRCRQQAPHLQGAHRLGVAANVPKKASRKNAVVDVPADNPAGTMDRFTAGLSRIPAAPKTPEYRSHQWKARKKAPHDPSESVPRRGRGSG